jgi:large subunit ribosomal protein L2
LGSISNKIHFLKFLRKAGQNRNLGFRSQVRGVAMNPVDHPHGGGQGKTKGAGGFRSQVTFKGLPAKNKATRSKKKSSSFIVSFRK